MQEEPANQGAWPFVALNLPDDSTVARCAASRARRRPRPAVGTHKVHEREQAELVAAAFA